MKQQQPFLCVSRFLHHRDADWIPVFARLTRRCWSATEEAELKSLPLILSPRQPHRAGVKPTEVAG